MAFSFLFPLSLFPPSKIRISAFAGVIHRGGGFFFFFFQLIDFKINPFVLLLLMLYKLSHDSYYSKTFLPFKLPTPYPSFLPIYLLFSLSVQQGESFKRDKFNARIT